MEEELLAPLPRRVPDRLRYHPRRVARHWSMRGVGLVLLGAAGLVWWGRDSTWAQAAGMYSELLDSPEVIVVLLSLLGAWGLCLFSFPGRLDSLDYVRHGVAVRGTVLDVETVVTERVDGGAARFGYRVLLEHPHLESGEMVETRFTSAPVTPDAQQLSCRRGDEITAIYLPGRSASTFTLYGWTGANPDAELIGRRPSGGWVWTALGLSVGAVLLAGAIAYAPTNDRNGLVAAWAVVCGVLVAGLTVWVQRGVYERGEAGRRRARAEGVAPAVGGSLGFQPWHWGFTGFFLGAMGGVGLLFSCNGVFDRGVPRVQTVRALEVSSVVLREVWNSYHVRFVHPDTGREDEESISPLILLRKPARLQLVTHPGALGIPWREMRGE